MTKGCPSRRPFLLPCINITNMLHKNIEWTIEYYSEDVRLEIAVMPVGIRAAYVRLTEMLQEFGLDLRMPHSRAMGGGLFESVECQENPALYA